MSYRGPMRPIRTLATLIACADLAAGPALAQAPAAAEPPPTAAEAGIDDPNQVSELVVVAHPQGPPIWRVTYNGAEMTIIGSVTPIQQQQRWDRRQTLAALEGARLVILPPTVGLNPIQVLALVTANVWRVRTLGELEPRLSPELRARFVAAREAARQPASRYAHWKPAVAGQLLLADSRHQFGYSMGKPGTTIAKIAKGMNIPTRVISHYSVNSLVGVATKLDDKQNLECLDDAVTQARYEGDHVQDMNDDWARGNVLSVNARYRIQPIQRCLMMVPGARKEIERAMGEAADRLWDELRKPGKTVAVMDMAWLLPKDGLLDRLKAHGATVGEPPQMASAEQAEGDGERD
ncbi:MAG: TraB/GumN family protein [Caulobacteraceae bacterium]